MLSRTLRSWAGNFVARYKILRRTKYRADISGQGADIRLDLDLSRFERQFQQAQYKLDSAIMDSMVPLMPMQSGTFINLTRGVSSSVAGSGKVVAAVGPMGQFLYYGKGMVDPMTGSPYARKGAKKVLVSQFSGKTNTRENLTYGRPGATSKWFEKAKEKHRDEWIRIVKETAGGGTRG